VRFPSPSAARSAGRVARASVTGGVVPPNRLTTEFTRRPHPALRATLPNFVGGGRKFVSDEIGPHYRGGAADRTGDGFVIPPGFKGTWETVEKVRKHYVILLPKS